jgi:putative toxin-antitoxin system antitoxin component (TIGR02293 family)
MAHCLRHQKMLHTASSDNAEANAMLVSPQQIADVLGGVEALGHEVDSLLDLDEVVAAGIPRSAFDALVDQLTAHADEVTRVGLRYKIIPRATYQRSRRLNVQYSETTERIARVYATVRRLWADDQEARRFLLTPHPELRGKTPLDAALTELGGRQVEEIIERALHGLPV